MLHLTIFVFSLVGCLCAPLDDPIRVDLPVYDQPQSASGVVLAEPLEEEKNDGEPLDGNHITQKFQSGENIFSHSSSPKTLPVGSINVQGGDGWFSPPVTTLEGAVFESEGLASKALSVKDNLHHLVSGLVQPKPIVDTIQEEEKYGNSGDKFYSAGRTIVGGAQSVSNLVNTALEVPGAIFKKIARAATEKLNNFGGRLIGL